MSRADDEGKIAIIGLSGRFPGAADAESFWELLIRGQEAIRFYSEEELLAEGIDPTLVRTPNYVRAHGEMAEAKTFDAAFFDMDDHEAEITDPQHRHFLEHAWLALENAGYDPQQLEGSIGVYGGMHVPSYLLRNLMPHADLVRRYGELELRLRNDKDFLTTLAAYKLGLDGPTVNVQTACASSLVAVILACQGLLTHQCDLALAGGVSIQSPVKTGYVSQPGLFSLDGHCRPFTAAASGTVSGNGVGVVALRRLDEARSQDHIRAVICGWGLTNDGADKVGYSAPGFIGQRDAIELAQICADYPETIELVEAHGTGTPMGDAVEVAALTAVYGAWAFGQSCALGSVKANIGHLDAAAGVAGLIKTVLALEHGQLPPQPSFEALNPELDLESGPFYVPTEARPWPRHEEPRHAAVSSFALGGVNAHVIVEEAPEPEPMPADDGPQLLVLSARTAAALETLSDRLAAELPQVSRNGDRLADVAYTLWYGRRAFAHRRIWMARDLDEASDILARRDPERLWTSAVGDERPVVYLFPGLGEQASEMGLELYQREKVFRQAFDQCCELFREHLGFDLRDQVYPRGTGVEAERDEPAGLDFRALVERARSGPPPEDDTEPDLTATEVAQPLVFTLGYALAMLWRYHIEAPPSAVLGHSLGELVAACVAGVLSLDDAVRLVATRARLIGGLPAGAMLAVTLSEEEVQPFLSPEVSLAVVAGPETTVVAGRLQQIAELEWRLKSEDVLCQRLATRHAFHSHLLDPVVERFTDAAAECELSPPEVPLVSTVTGTWMTPEQATDPAYWGAQLRRTVRFGDALGVLWQEPSVLLELGPGSSLAAWARQHPSCPDAGCVVSALPHALDGRSDQAAMLEAIGKVWLVGGKLEHRMYTYFIDGVYGARRRVPLPTYPFERREYWIDPPSAFGDVPFGGSAFDGAAASAATDDGGDPQAWLAERQGPWLVFTVEELWLEAAIEHLTSRGETVWRVAAGAAFEHRGEGDFVLAPERLEDHRALVAALAEGGVWPGSVAHFWSLRGSGGFAAAADERSLLHLAQALGAADAPSLADMLAPAAELARLRRWSTASAAAAQPSEVIRTTYEAPRNQLEERLCELFARLLGRQRVGIHDSFFDLGGDSLRAARCLSLIEEEHGVALRLKTLFEAPQVARLAPLLVAARAAELDEDEVLAALAESKGVSKAALLAELAGQEAAEESD